MWWLAFVELSLFFILAAIVAWVFFKPVKKKKSGTHKSDHS